MDTVPLNDSCAREIQGRTMPKVQSFIIVYELSGVTDKLGGGGNLVLIHHKFGMTSTNASAALMQSILAFIITMKCLTYCNVL